MSLSANFYFVLIQHFAQQDLIFLSATVLELSFRGYKKITTNQFYWRWVHACKHFEQDSDICWIQSSFGQHRTKSLTCSRIGGCSTQC